MAHPFSTPQPGNRHACGTILADDFDARLQALMVQLSAEQAAAEAQNRALAALRPFQPPDGCACSAWQLATSVCACHREDDVNADPTGDEE